MKEEWYFWSEVIGAKINDANLGAVVSEDDLNDVVDEVVRALHNAKGALRNAVKNRMNISPSKMLKIQQRRADLGRLHQALLQRTSEMSRKEKEERIRQADERERLRPFSKFFQEVVRHEASPVDYHRWIAQAKQRQQEADR